MVTVNYEEIFSQLPGYWFIKNCDSIYLSANKAFLETVNSTNVVGKTDYDMPWATQADDYIADDRRVFQGIKLINYLEPQLRADQGLFVVRVTKIPLYVGDQIGGLICQFSDYKKPAQLALSKQQTICLMLLTQGLLAKQIAAKMNLSVRTVESYIAILKDKLNCQNKADLIREGLRYFNPVV